MARRVLSTDEALRELEEMARIIGEMEQGFLHVQRLAKRLISRDIWAGGRSVQFSSSVEEIYAMVQKAIAHVWDVQKHAREVNQRIQEAGADLPAGNIGISDPTSTPTPPPISTPVSTSPSESGFQDPTGGKMKDTPYYHYGDPYKSGNYKGKPHPGIDIKGNEGDPIRPIGPGKVVKVGYDEKGYGHYIVVEHVLPDGTKIYSVYAHLKSKPPVGVGQEVTKDTIIGGMGRSGKGSNNITHLHLEIRTEKGMYPWRDFGDLDKPNWKDYWIDPEKIIGAGVPARQGKV